jgi:endonuclease/exonuclease/phosphatase family metal-dependent hydrolase
MIESILSTINWIGSLIIVLVLTIIYVISQVICGVDTKNGGGMGVSSVSSVSSVGSEVTGVDSEVGSDTADKKYKFLSFNVEYEATNYSPAEVMQIIDSLGADVVVLNEAHETEGMLQTNAEYSSKIADALVREGTNYVYSHDWAIIASKLSIEQPYKNSEVNTAPVATTAEVPNDSVLLTPVTTETDTLSAPVTSLSSEVTADTTAEVTTPTSPNKYLNSAALIDNKFYVISAHLTDYPYQPFQLAHIPYCYETCQKNICPQPYVAADAKSKNTKGKKCSKNLAESQMIDEAHKARGEDVDLILAAIKYLNATGRPVLLAGDFNEPSHLDWSDDAVTAGQQPLRVRFPTSSRLAEAGMVDIFRAIHPDPTKNPGHTWPARPLTREYLSDLSLGAIKEQISTPTDRIDFIYGMGITPISADVVVTPSDHNAVIAEFAI